MDGGVRTWFLEGGSYFGQEGGLMGMGDAGHFERFSGEVMDVEQACADFFKVALF